MGVVMGVVDGVTCLEMKDQVNTAYTIALEYISKAWSPWAQMAIRCKYYINFVALDTSFKIVL